MDKGEIKKKKSILFRQKIISLFYKMITRTAVTVTVVTEFMTLSLFTLKQKTKSMRPA